MMLSKNCGEVMHELYNHENAKDQPFLGIYILNKPALLIRDPELIKTILVRNFHKFSDRYVNCDTKKDPLGSGNLFIIKNPKWKMLRTMISPVFSSGKLKQMFPLIQDVGNELDKHLCDKGNKSFTIEVKEMCALFTTDVIATVAFGIKTNSLKNPDNNFRRISRNFTHFTVWRAIEFAVAFFLPQFATLFQCKLFSRESEKFFRASIELIMKERIKNGRIRNDLIDTLVELKRNNVLHQETRLDISNDLLVAQAAVFFFAGSETTASTMSNCLYELSRSPKIQNRLREEIREVLKKNSKGLFTYEEINAMGYLDMVVMETLRIYPLLPIIDRVCTLSSGEKDFSLKPWSDFAVPDKMPVYIPRMALQSDPKYFSNPELFDPERFSTTNKPKIKSGTFLPFGLGPRNCVGYRLGLLQTKIGLINILRNHFISTSDKTPKKMIIDPRALFRQSKGGILCKFHWDPLI